MGLLGGLGAGVKMLPRGKIWKKIIKPDLDIYKNNPSEGKKNGIPVKTGKISCLVLT